MFKIIALGLFSIVTLLSEDGLISSVSVNGGVEARIEARSPLIVAVDLLSRTEIASAEWPLELTDSKDNPVSVAAVLRTAEPSTRVGRFFVGSAVWTIAPEVTAVLPAGEYRVRVRGSRAARFHILNASPAENVDNRVEHLLLLSEFAQLEGNLEGAIEHANRVLEIDKGSVPGRIRKSSLLLEKGELASALQVADEAESLLVREQPSGHPPAQLLRLQADILNRIK